MAKSILIYSFSKGADKMANNIDGKSPREKEERPREYTKEELDAARKKIDK